MYRRLTHSDLERITALNVPFDKYDTVEINLRPLTQAEFAAMVAVRGPWIARTDELAAALSAQIAATEKAENLGNDLSQLISHFFQVFNLGVARNYFSANSRATYKLDVSSAISPLPTNHGDRLYWANNIVIGEAMRAAAEGPGTLPTLDSGLHLDEGVHLDTPVGGYKPMALPSAAEVAACLAAYKAAHVLASNAKDAYLRALKLVQELRPGVDNQIREQWDAIEYFFRHEEPANLRRKAREWGVVYVSRPGEPADPTPPAPPPTP